MRYCYSSSPYSMFRLYSQLSIIFNYIHNKFKQKFISQKKIGTYYLLLTQQYGE